MRVKLLSISMLVLFMCVSFSSQTNADAVWQPFQTEKETFTIQGTVTDPDGAGIPGAKVILYGTGIAASVTVATNQFGKYQFPDVPDGAYTVAVQKNGYISYSMGVVPSPFVNQTNFTLYPEYYRIQGKVTDETGRPVSAAQITISKDGETRYQTSTNASGDYKVENIFYGVYFISAQKTGYTQSGKTLKINQSLENEDFSIQPEK